MKVIKTEIAYTDGKSYNAGDEDAFEKVVSVAECDRLKAKGAIDGDWDPKVDKPKAPRVARVPK